jgi:hypothetical protein
MHDKQQKAAWLAKFDDPIPLPERGSIKTLSDARAHMLKLPKREQLKPRWQDAVRYVLKAVEERPKEHPTKARAREQGGGLPLRRGRRSGGGG